MAEIKSKSLKEIVLENIPIVVAGVLITILGLITIDFCSDIYRNILLKIQPSIKYGGFVVVLGFLIRQIIVSYHLQLKVENLKEQHEKEIELLKAVNNVFNVSNEEEKILEIIFNNPDSKLSTEDILKSYNEKTSDKLNKQIISHYLNELQNKIMVYQEYTGTSINGYNAWIINQNGSRYIMKKLKHNK